MSSVSWEADRSMTSRGKCTTREELRKRYGSTLWVPAPRFGTDKQIDEEGNPKVPSAISACFKKINVAGVDGTAGAAKLWSDLAARARSNRRWAFSTTLSTGEKLPGVLHKDVREGGNL